MRRTLGFCFDFWALVIQSWWRQRERESRWGFTQKGFNFCLTLRACCPYSRQSNSVWFARLDLEVAREKQMHPGKREVGVQGRGNTALCMFLQFMLPFMQGDVNRLVGREYNRSALKRVPTSFYFSLRKGSKQPCQGFFLQNIWANKRLQCCWSSLKWQLRIQTTLQVNIVHLTLTFSVYIRFILASQCI